MNHPGFARVFVLAALCGAAAVLVAWLDASPREAPTPTPAAGLPRLPTTWEAGQWVSDGGCAVWVLNRSEHRNEVFRGWLMGAADFHGRVFTACDFRDAVLTRANFRGAELWECDFRRADLESADLTGATYDSFTRWPTGFDPRAHGAALDVPLPTVRPPATTGERLRAHRQHASRSPHGRRHRRH